MNHFYRLIATFLFLTSVLSAQEDDGLRPVRGMIPVPLWQQPWVWITLAVTLVVAAIALIFFLKSRKPKVIKQPTAYELALKDLEDARKLMDAGEDKAFSIAISNTVRYYIERAYKVAAPEQTTEEFLTEASKHPRLSGEPLHQLSAFLQLCDMAKFAQQTFGETQRSEQYNSAFQFIDKSHQEEMNQMHNPATSASKEPLEVAQK